MSLHAFVDESKVGGLTLFATLVDSAAVTRTRAEVSTMRRKGSRRFHASKDGPRQRSVAVQILTKLALPVRAYDFRSLGDGPTARRAALEVLVPDLSAIGVGRIVLERDESTITQDKQHLYRAVRAARCLGRPLIEYDHLRASDEPLLWPSDLVGWCWFKKTWRPRVEGLVDFWHVAAA